MSSVITYVTGGAHAAAGTFHGYHTDANTTPASVVDRFIADGLDGHILITAEQPVPGRTETIYDITGEEKTVPYTIVHNLRAYRRGRYGAAHYWRGDATTGQSWITHTTNPPSDPPQIDGTGWYDDTFPADAIVSTDSLHNAMREFVHTGQQPTTVGWREVPTDTTPNA